MMPIILIVSFIVAVIDWNTGRHFDKWLKKATIFEISGWIGAITMAIYFSIGRPT